MMMVPGLPPKQGLYDPRYEKDSCGIGFVVNIKGQKSHSIVQKGLQVLENLFHRGAQGCDPCTGDGAGILLQVPHEFLRRAAADVGIKLPGAGEYGVGMVFLPRDAAARKQCETLVERVIAEERARFLGWRDVPVKSEAIGTVARRTEPVIRQVFIARDILNEGQFERKLYVIRKRVEKAIRESAIQGREYFYIPSLSSNTIVYKGLLLPRQIPQYYQDLTDTSVTSALALVHSRFSTNTFPTWPLAHPYRYICHNGEINTLKGNVNWMRARQGRLQSDLFGSDMPKLFPIVYEHQSDSACLDNALEFLVLGGRSLPHAMMMLIPEPWVGNPHMDLDRRGFYEYHAAMMEPWDGPAAVCFTDGKLIGATLDRNGLRPCRYQVMTDDLVVLASEAGVLPADVKEIRQKGRLQPGRMFLVDTVQGRIIDDEEIKADIVGRKPYRAWVTQYRISLDELPEPLNVPQPDHPTIRQRQQAFGYTVEELKMVITPDGGDRRGARLLHGNRHAAGRAVGAAAIALQILQATVRSGDQPADRPDPRGVGHVAGHEHRAQAQSHGGASGILPPDQSQTTDPDQCGPPENPGARGPAFPEQDLAHAVPRGRGAGRARRGGGRAVPPGVRGDQGRLSVSDPERPGV
ncbi:MAG: hypothetical protein KatS3mg082_0200 [Nitrospiraceae bacterium]|nr:MAG: hypothetical protein KatS3mg082_0200 [Nitrospiraceae bacterium]